MDDVAKVDWEDILVSTEEDFLAGRFAFNFADYPTDEAAWAAFDTWLHSVVTEVDCEIASPNASAATG